MNIEQNKELFNIKNIKKLQICSTVNLYFKKSGYRFQHSIYKSKPEKLDNWDMFYNEKILYPEMKLLTSKDKFMLISILLRHYKVKVNNKELYKILEGFI